MRKSTINKLANIAASEKMNLFVADDDRSVLLRDDYGNRISAELVDGAWVLASWDCQNSQWRSSDMPASFIKANSGFSYAFANTLKGLVDYGVRTYRSPVAAIRSEIAARNAA